VSALRIGLLLGALMAGGAAALEADPADVAALSACADAHLPDVRAAGGACIGLTSTPCLVRPEAQTTTGMVVCMGAEHAAWDVLLNRDWPRVMAQARGIDAAQAAEPALPSAADTLLTAQRAWLAWREVECPSRMAPHGAGSITRIIAADCMLDLTATRTLALRARLTGD
jgi:uncharacterized protein YecT (DUF1311 family)